MARSQGGCQRLQAPPRPSPPAQQTRLRRAFLPLSNPCRDMVTRVQEEFGKLDILVNK
jgi:NAD(P)-dependent dehydrogenase (short-subunit alcohol dehydrogenase family)